MRDHSFGADAKDAVRHLLVRRYPAERIASPAELRESEVEPRGKGGKHDLDVEVTDSLLGRLGWHLQPPRARLGHLYQIWVDARKLVEKRRVASGRSLSGPRAVSRICALA